MPATDLSSIAVEAMRLQNGYALAVDTRDWDYFRTLFTPDVVALYPNRLYHGQEAWLAEFIPFHAECTWTSHVMTTHVVGEDEKGIWATCYGWVQWTQRESSALISRATVLYRDRLGESDGVWRIAKRKLDLLMIEPLAPIPSGITMVQSVLDLADRT